MRAVLHLLTFLLPVAVLAFLLAGPQQGWGPLAGIGCLLALIAADCVAPAEHRDPPATLPGAFFDGVLACLTALHVAVVVALPFYVDVASPSAALVAILLVGNTSAQGIVLAHELIHRRGARFRLPGRLLLALVVYEHFYTEHLRGHHKNVGLPGDPATASWGERFWPFLARTVPSQFMSAWQLETKRLKGDPWTLDNRVLQGLAVGWGVVVLVGGVFGPTAMAAHLGQAVVAVLLLEAVNYIEHWGLQRQGKRVQPADSWDSTGALTYYMLIGLARHGDHHAHAARPWQDLRLFADTPKMPWGYLATAYAAIFIDRVLIDRFDTELRRKALGPYRGVAA